MKAVLDKLKAQVYKIPKVPFVSTEGLEEKIANLNFSLMFRIVGQLNSDNAADKLSSSKRFWSS